MARIALISGVAGGIGLATSRIFRNEGWFVIGLDRRPPDEPESVDRFIEVNLADARAIQSIAPELVPYGHVDALINNAAVQVAKPLVETTTDEWDLVMNVNVRAAYLLMQVVYPLMRSRGGAVVNISSVHAIATSKSIAAYAASKGALMALTRAVALEFAGDGIRVNAVLPGAVDTGMLRAGLSRRPGEGGEDLGLRILGSKTPMGRVGEPEEIAQTIVFLSDKNRSSYMTGQTLVVDGGATARLSTE